MKVLVLNGPNLHLLGRRKPEIYGKATLHDINKAVLNEAVKLGITVKSFQTNYEGKLIDLITEYMDWADGIMINAGALTHYSYALRDAIEASGLPAAEVHLSDISSREDFRRISVILPVCAGQFMGKGTESYIEALRFLAEKIRG